MTSDAFLLMQAWLVNIWRLFTSWHIPGTNFSPAQWFFFLLMAPLTVRLVKSILTFALAEFLSDDYKSPISDSTSLTVKGHTNDFK